MCLCLSVSVYLSVCVCGVCLCSFASAPLADGEHMLEKGTKSVETLVEARSDTDGQIVRCLWEKGAKD